MAHWFHRNPIKATAPIPFDLRQVIGGPAASKLCSEVRLSRGRLLDFLRDSNNELELVENEFRLYCSLLQGNPQLWNGTWIHSVWEMNLLNRFFDSDQKNFETLLFASSIAGKSYDSPFQKGIIKSAGWVITEKFILQDSLFHSMRKAGKASCVVWFVSSGHKVVWGPKQCKYYFHIVFIIGFQRFCINI